MHAEMNVLRFSRPGDEIIVLRFHANGTLTNSKPCTYCEKFIKEYGISKVTYSDWNGELQELNLN